MTRRAWFLGGAALGLALPVAIKVYGILTFDSVRPIVLWLLWPTASMFQLFSISHSYTGISAVILFLLAILGNGLLYGLFASVLRVASLGVVVLLPIIIWVFLPPSDSSLVKRFKEHRDDFERLVQMANSDPHLIRISPSMIVTDDGREFGVTAPQTVLSENRWTQYRTFFKADGLDDGLYRTGGDILLNVRGAGKIDPVGSSYGYVYCRTLNEQSGFLPCVEDQGMAKRSGHRWKRIDSGWYIYEAFAGAS